MLTISTVKSERTVFFFIESDNDNGQWLSLTSPLDNILMNTIHYCNVFISGGTIGPATGIVDKVLQVLVRLFVDQLLEIMSCAKGSLISETSRVTQGIAFDQSRYSMKGMICIDRHLTASMPLDFEGGNSNIHPWSQTSSLNNHWDSSKPPSSSSSTSSLSSLSLLLLLLLSLLLLCIIIITYCYDCYYYYYWYPISLYIITFYYDYNLFLFYLLL